LATNEGTLLVIALALPLAMLCACVSKQLRHLMPSLLVLAPLPALAAACLEADGSTVTFSPALLGLTLILDRPGAMLLGVGALLWTAAGAYAGSYLRDKPNAGGFAVWWLMTLTGNFGAFLAADLPGFYFFFTLASLSAFGLVVFDGTAEAKRAGAVYVGLAVLGEALLLMAFVLMAAAVPSGGLLVSDAVTSLEASPWREYAMAFLVLAFGLKIGLFPFHVWMPLTYSAAPIPAAAVLSGSAVKVGVIGLIRFLPFDTAMPEWGQVLVIVGLFSAFYGVVIGITQANPKTVLAYSSVSQMGLLAAALGMGLSAGEKSAVLVAAFSATFHVLVKGGLFLAVGVAGSTRRSLWVVLVPAAVLALGFGGLPWTGGALAKLAMKPLMGEGIVGALATFSATGSTLLMLHFLRRMWSGSQQPETTGSSALVLPWLAIALAAIVLPWILYSRVTSGLLRDALAPKEIWEGLWPMLLGALAGLALWRCGRFLPRIPAGDLLASDKRLARLASALGAAMEKIDGHLREWPVACAVLLGLAIILGSSTFVGR
jgi:formate hydrogenlyase subunit 3/multisubunit Na+/H+ antiporter MnhD subunit